ncbi:MAG: hypothetical protein Q9169_007786 [Polycauliona sp. 2 TL-2023]
MAYPFNRSCDPVRRHRKPENSKSRNKNNKMQSGAWRDPEGPPENLGQMIADYVRSMSEILASNEFRDFVLWSHRELQTEDIRPLLWAHPAPKETPKLDWQVIDRRLNMDVKLLHRARLIAQGSHPKPQHHETPNGLWVHEFNEAVRILGANETATMNYIQALADGKVTSYGGIQQLLINRDSRELAYQLVRSTENLDWFFRVRGNTDGEVAMRNILERIKGRYFTCCFIQDDEPVYSLSEFAVKQHMRP